jgi:hypothetical protein
VCLAAVFALGCRSAHPVNSPELVAAPVPAPAVGVAGCVESDELRAYASALEAERRRASDAALTQLGARREARQGVFLDSALSAKVDDVLEDRGKRYAVVAHRAVGFEPQVTIAKRAGELYRIDERPRGHGVPVLVCGITPCPRPRGGARAEVRAVGVELAPGETFGAPLVVAYDYWWAQVTYPKRARCDAP